MTAGSDAIPTSPGYRADRPGPVGRGGLLCPIARGPRNSASARTVNHTHVIYTPLAPMTPCLRLGRVQKGSSRLRNSGQSLTVPIVGADAPAGLLDAVQHRCRSAHRSVPAVASLDGRAGGTRRQRLLELPHKPVD